MKEITPVSSYRLELSRGFDLEAAAQLVPYLAALGIEMVFLSPYFESERGSPNPYKIISPDHVNPLLGGRLGFEKFTKALRRYRLLHMVDVISNHMGATVDNPWWRDVLKYGKDSKYAIFFDVDWEGAGGKIVCPFLHDDSRLFKRGKVLYVDGKKYPLKKGTEHLPLNELLEQQHYILCHWRETYKRINYRRFFDISELVGLRMEEEKVYQRYHKAVFRWASKHKVQGLRIDHPDGLFDPSYYLKKIHTKYPLLYVVCEKILQFNEFMRKDWKARGTVGYDMLNTLNALFVDTSSKKAFDHIYHGFAGQRKDPEILLADLKKNYMKRYLPAEINMIARKIGKKYKRALIEFLAHFPIYRSYISPTEKKIDPLDLKAIRMAIRKSDMKEEEKKFFGKTFLTLPYRAVLIRTEQLMPAVFAKGFEDTFLYQYNRLVSLNEVGSTPTKFGISTHEFHAINQKRAKMYPETMIATSTHDTKRSHDVRMRISVLSEMPEKWSEKLHEWREINGSFIDHNMEYFFYQTLVGLWPDRPPKNKEETQGRLDSYLTKAAREAKKYTDWIDRNYRYENALLHFSQKVTSNAKFWKSFYPFQQEVTLYGMHNSLSSLVLKLGMPGVVDFYQGEELFRYDLVDPDNRREVDFRKRAKVLKEIQKKNPPLEEWYAYPHDGRLKMYLTWKGLELRKKEKELFLHGEYIPVDTGHKNVVAFMRKLGRKKALVMASRFYSKHPGVILPPEHGWMDVFSEEESTPLPFSIRLYVNK